MGNLTRFLSDGVTDIENVIKLFDVEASCARKPLVKCFNKKSVIEKDFILIN